MVERANPSDFIKDMKPQIELSSEPPQVVYVVQDQKEAERRFQLCVIALALCFFVVLYAIYRGKEK